MKYSKSVLILFSLLFISVILILFLQYDRNKIKKEIITNQILLSSFIKDSNDRAQLEGKELYHLLNISKDMFLSFLKTYGKEYNIFFIVDSIDCYSCFQFHTDHINEFFKKNIPIFSYSSIHSDYLSNSLFKSINFPHKENYKNKIIDNSNMAILLINNVGKIIYADVADKTNYEKSKKFYSKINSFISDE